MAKSLPRVCFLCGKSIRYASTNKRAIKQGLPTGANTHDLDAKSEMHYAHATGKSRSRDQFRDLPQPVWDAIGVRDIQGSRICCYECHEVILHNPVLSESQLDRLAALFNGQSFEARVIALNRIIESGLTAFELERNALAGS
jgi:hypothetical protein